MILSLPISFMDRFWISCEEIAISLKRNSYNLKGLKCTDISNISCTEKVINDKMQVS
jgi:hypothetical protein